MSSGLMEMVSVVKGQGTIEGVLMKCDTGEIDGRPWYSIRFEHARLPVKVPASLDVYKQLHPHVGAEVRLHVSFEPDLDRMVRGERASNALVLIPRAVRAEVLRSGNNPNPELAVEPQQGPKVKKGFI